MNNLNTDDIKVSSKLDNTIDKAIEKGFSSSKKNNHKKSVLAAGIAFATIVTITFPSYAQNLPLVGDIFKELNIFNSDLYSSYKEYSQGLNLTKEDKGVSITINDAVFDGRTISLTYSIKSDKDLGNNFTLKNSLTLNNYDISGYSGTLYFKKIDDFNYIGQENYTIYNFVNNPASEAKVNLTINEITMHDTDTSLQGNWKFNFKLTSNKTDEYIVNQTVEKAGAKFSANTLTINAMNIFLNTYYEISTPLIKEYPTTFLNIEVKDDLNNSYYAELTTQAGDINYANSSFTISKLKDGAKKLIITPKIKLGSSDTIILDDVIVELNSLDISDNTTSNDAAPPILENNLIITNNITEVLKSIELISYDRSEIMTSPGVMMSANGSLITPGQEIEHR